jgi:hypothetical protein
LGDFEELEHVEPTLAPLVLGEERLRPAKAAATTGLG